jgi:thiol-disulfide isomerase/thioredoxin
VKKSYLIGILLAGAALMIIVAATATHWQRVLAARSSAEPRARRAPTNNNSSEPADDEDVKVVRFASNAIEAPPFLLPDLQGHVISTAQFPGHIVLLNFWATWCPPCREEIPELRELQSRYKDQLQVVGVSLDDEPAQQVAQFVARAGINYSIVMGNAEMVKEYGGVPALPTNFLIDQRGRVVQKHVGLYPLNVYDTEVRALLGMHVDAKVETFTDEGQIFLKNAMLATELPGVDFKGLTEAQKKAALRRMNSEDCTCGCQMTIAQCRLLDSSCPVSKALAAKIVQEIKAGTPAAAHGSTAAGR